MIEYSKIYCGSQPVQTNPFPSTENFGHRIVARDHLDAPDYVIIPDPQMKIERAGIVRGWRAYIEEVGDFISFQVWRHIRVNKYVLIGQTEYWPTKEGVSEIILPVHDRFAVSPGDVLGLLFELPSVPFDMFTDECNKEVSTRFFELFDLSDDMSPGNYVKMDVWMNECREYSFQVILG